LPLTRRASERYGSGIMRARHEYYSTPIQAARCVTDRPGLHRFEYSAKLIRNLDT
jgi:hypothetical protein